MTEKQRFQSTVLGDTINLDFYAYNNGELVDVYFIQKVEVYFLDSTQVSPSNQDGRRIKKIFAHDEIIKVSTGHYMVQLYLDDSLYEIGNYIDVWKVKFNDYDKQYYNNENQFKIYTDLRETSGAPFLYKIDYKFSPYKIIRGSKQYVQVEYYPVINKDDQKTTQLEDIMNKFYYNLKTTSGLYIRIEMIEGCNYNTDCPYANIKTDPEWENIEIRGDNIGVYLLDTTEDTGIYDLGIYSVQFKSIIDNQEILSQKFYLQIYD